MRKLLNDLRLKLNEFCPTYLHIPFDVSYPHMTLEPEQNLNGLPWGPSVLLMKIKIWSRYKGTLEILKLAKQIEGSLLHNIPQTMRISTKLTESSLILLKDGETRTHTFHLKVRYQKEPSHE